MELEMSAKGLMNLWDSSQKYRICSQMLSWHRDRRLSTFHISFLQCLNSKVASSFSKCRVRTSRYSFVGNLEYFVQM